MMTPMLDKQFDLGSAFVARLCSACSAAVARHGVPSGARGFTSRELMRLTALAHPVGRVVSRAEKERAKCLNACLRAIAKAGPAEAEIADRPMLLCAACHGARAEFTLEPGGVAFIGAPLAARLLPFTALRRVRMDEARLQEGAALESTLFRALRDMFRSVSDEGWQRWCLGGAQLCNHTVVMVATQPTGSNSGVVIAQ